ncbi:hypothetical protein [Anaeromyxobacter dehalogenans]|uniref:DUF1835 domain-containing protein n=1 Tax=Anaeromyxobacter dehalogenans (strain 2CP-C) TaxID=290397 RepID=Q2IQV5_ANADE|nr:hypothetical protein [Anaeromyxobacter dehalogenans]ABC81186.1 hypothetical protein Adeh_1413 [Anaeromyxobacter dehalogenans 2CP-C]
MKLVHLVQGAMAEASVKAASAGEVIGVVDDLTYGPCSLSPIRHALLRRRFWQAEAEGGPGGRWLSQDRTERADTHVFSADELGRRLSVLADDFRVCLWVSGHWREMLFGCWAADALHRIGVAEERVLIGRPRAPKQPVAWIDETDLNEAVERAAPMSPKWKAGALRVWRSYCQSAAAIEQLRSSHPAVLPRLGSALRHYADLLPREGTRSRSRLSRLDEAILGALSSKAWRVYPELFRSLSSPLSRFVNIFGDLPVSRVWHWSQHRRGMFIERAPEGTDETGPGFRLTETGVELLRDGLTRFDDAPPLQVGGHLAYGRTDPWLVVERGASWRMRRAGHSPRSRRRL